MYTDNNHGSLTAHHGRMLPKAVLQTAASPPAAPALPPAADAAVLERGAGALETLETTAYLFVNSTLAKPGKEEFDYSKNLDGRTSLGRPWGPLATVVRSELTPHHTLRSLGLAAVFHLLPATACVPHLPQAVNRYYAVHTCLVPNHSPTTSHGVLCVIHSIHPMQGLQRLLDGWSQSLPLFATRMHSRRH